VRNFDSVGDNDWLEGGEAIEAMLNSSPAALPIVRKSKKMPRSTHRKPVAKRKPRVCLDLDGVLAKYEGWRGADHIGTPLPGALEFAWSLSQFADIIIFTSRCSQDAGSEERSRVSPGQMKIRIIDWLEKYKFPYTDVYVGQGKPRAAAFIDDRAVRCSPQTDKDAFSKALASTRSVVKG
jgi:hypothetical protein